MPKSVLIIGEDPTQIDFDAPDAPKGMSAAKVMDGLNASLAELRDRGYAADMLLTTTAGTVDRGPPRCSPRPPTTSS